MERINEFWTTADGKKLQLAGRCATNQPLPLSLIDTLGLSPMHICLEGHLFELMVCSFGLGIPGTRNVYILFPVFSTLIPM